MSAGGASISLRGIRFGYAPGQPPLAFDLEIGRGDIVAVMGPSGSGKTTLLHLIAGFEIPEAGKVLIDGTDVTRLGPAVRPVSMVFQENNLFAHLDVLSNVGLGRSPSLSLGPADRDDIAAALARTGLAGMEARLPGQLSGGERQRVALARALVRRRPVLLLDEPFASLGPALRTQMLDLLLQLHAEHGMTIVLVTHHPEDARACARRIVFIEHGTVAATGSTERFFSGDGPDVFRHYIGTQMRAASQLP